jgi:hypothetical protein
MRNAAEVMLPALRRALHGFTKRADIVIRQLSFLSSQQDDDIVEVCRELSDLDDDEFGLRLARASHHMETMKLGLVDPKQVRLVERKKKPVVDTSVHEYSDVDEDARHDLIIQQLLDRAFVFNRQDLKDYIVTALKEKQHISSAQLPIESAPELLALAHIIEVGSVNNLDSDFEFSVQATGKTLTNAYFSQADEFNIELRKKESHNL